VIATGVPVPVRRPNHRLLHSEAAEADFSDARLFNLRSVNRPSHYGDALSADGMSVTGDLFCHKLSTRGEVRLLEARIGGNAEFQGARLRNPKGDALSADGMTVSGHLFCKRGFLAYGTLRLPGIRVTGDLDLRGARLVGRNEWALYLERAHVGQTFILDQAAVLTRAIDVTDASVRHLSDAEMSWPRKSRLIGFTYGTPTGERADRVQWLRTTADGGYIPQPYDQLASAYRSNGRGQDARAVMIAKQQDRRALGNRRHLKKEHLAARLRRSITAAWSWLLRSTIGYGYAPWRALFWFAAVWTIASLVFAQARLGDDLTARPGEHDQYHPIAYALDLLLPVVNLQQRQHWIPNHGYFWWTIGFTIMGWLIATVVVAGLADLFKHD
jgi:hypothetical protein